MCSAIPASAGDELKARKPLAGAEVKVEEIEGNPGYYSREVPSAAALPARGSQRDVEPGLAPAVGEDGLDVEVECGAACNSIGIGTITSN